MVVVVVVVMLVHFLKCNKIVRLLRYNVYKFQTVGFEATGTGKTMYVYDALHTQHTTVLWLCGICPGKPG